MMATNHPAVGPAMRAEFPEVVNYARVVDPSLFIPSSAISYKDHAGNLTTFNEGKMYIADSTFFTMFSYPLIRGSAATVLSQPNVIVISQAAADKYFGKEDPVGKTVYLNQRMPFTISGVFKDIPENSHIKFDMLISFKTIDNNGMMAGNWTWPEFYNYVQLAAGADPKKIEAKFPAFINKHLADVLRQYSFGCAFHLQRVTDIHLKSAYLKEAEVNGSEKEIYFLTLIGIFILTIVPGRSAIRKSIRVVYDAGYFRCLSRVARIIQFYDPSSHAGDRNPESAGRIRIPHTGIIFKGFRADDLSCFRDCDTRDLFHGV